MCVWGGVNQPNQNDESRRLEREEKREENIQEMTQDSRREEAEKIRGCGETKASRTNQKA